MLGLVLAALLAVPSGTPPPFAEQVATHYANRDAAGLARLYRSASTREQRLMCRYRLYPMTRNAAYLENLPTDTDGYSAREMAMLSALWAMRANEAPLYRLPHYGRRSEAILDRARAASPSDPYVLLVYGQSLYYKPTWFGGSPAQALTTFQRLREVVRSQSGTGVTLWEAEIWVWMALRKLERDSAPRVREALLAQNPPPMYRQFLVDPPE